MSVPEVGIVTDEVSLDIREAINWCQDHGIQQVELRNAREGRFPSFTKEEMQLLEDAVRDGTIEVKAVSPGILKSAADDQSQINYELQEVLPHALEKAARLSCQRIIVFGFEHYDGEPDENRARVKETYERCAEQCAKVGAEALIENEPNFWVDRPKNEAQLLKEIGHDALAANWDPTNAVRGGYVVERSGFEAILPHLRNLHIKDYDPQGNPKKVALGKGVVPWRKLLPWIIDETNLKSVTLEPSVSPNPSLSRRSLGALRDLLREVSAAQEKAG